MHTQASFTVGMLLYPQFTLLALAGPQAALGMHGRTLLLWKNHEAVPTDTGIALAPTTTFAECPTELDVLFVPGGFGTVAAMRDAEVVDFLADVGRRARFVTSVCTGSLLLGVAGLLEGYRAATHWACHEALAATGAVARKQRVVTDRNRVSGGGVTAGIDFGLTLAALLRNRAEAEAIQLIIEYAPAPPFNAGTPETAPKALVERIVANRAPAWERARQTALRAAASFKG